MFGNPEVTFKARIKIGAPIDHDFGYFRWPACKPPRAKPKVDPDMEFTAEYTGRHFWLKAHGYGGGTGDGYGNGSIGVSDINDLIVSNEDREVVLAHMRAKKQAEITKAEGATKKLRDELASIR